MFKIVCLFILLNLAFSQSSIGFSDPSQIRLIKSYTIPTYQYSLLDIYSEYSLNKTPDRLVTENYNGQNFTYKVRGDQRTNYALSTSAYHLYDSESMYYEITGEYIYGGGSITYNAPNSNNDDVENDYNRYNIYGKLNFYLKDLPVFLHTSFILNNSVDEKNSIYSSTLSSDKLESKTITDLNRTTFSIGLGVGKIRHVNHVLRSIRLSERFKSIGLSGLTDNEILNVAKVLSKEKAYTSLFSRSKKHIWKAIFETINFDVSDIDPYHLFFLDEIFNEAIGMRKEGYEFKAVINTYKNDQTRTVRSYRNGSQTFKSEEALEEELSSFQFSGLFYNNLTLNSQVKLALSYENLTLPEPKDKFDNTFITPEVAFLTTITDRVLWETTANYIIFNQSLKKLEEEKNTLSVRSEFKVFIEDYVTLGLMFNFQEVEIDSKIISVDRSINLNFNYNLFQSFH